ncbi:hypothetical protein [Knoellia sp. Soil729]|uniref:hypothetical protein n=1 Tax=Knoellia sp. Soil729 TaxID=1736394 RepID=UPI0006F3C0EA|nr:hypothetical protein [Knoellia sp. Soil729]KRE43509.1 hypothetical protein ASG74_01265 [Knoellia sp. Soil729]
MLGAAAPLPFDPGTLRPASDLRRSGIEPSRGAWHHVRRGVWMDAGVWATLDSTQKHAAFVHATALLRRLEEPVVCAVEAAAAVWGLPRIEAWPAFVRHHVCDRRVRGSALLRPFLGAEVEPVERQGLLVTPVARTIVDLARTGSLFTAVAAADHALRHELCAAEDLAAEVSSVPARAPGRVRAAVVRDLADPLSMSPGESLSRVQMFRLNLPRPELQHAVHDDEGLAGTVDFWWEGVVGEFDGKTKYRVPAGASAEEAAEIVWREKKREDRLRRKAAVGRWTYREAMQPQVLAQVLAQAGVTAVARPRWFDVGSGNVA